MRVLESMGATEDKRRAAKNLRTALILGSIALVFFIGFLLRRTAG
jgi:hypothetical protein